MVQDEQKVQKAEMMVTSGAEEQNNNKAVETENTTSVAVTKPNAASSENTDVKISTVQQNDDATHEPAQPIQAQASASQGEQLSSPKAGTSKAAKKQYAGTAQTRCSPSDITLEDMLLGGDMGESSDRLSDTPLSDEHDENSAEPMEVVTEQPNLPQQKRASSGRQSKRGAKK